MDTPLDKIEILVELEVLCFEKLEQFERAAVSIMSDYGGVLASAFEIERNEHGGGKEIHLLQFPSIEAFSHYREDARHLQLATDRSEAITHTNVKVGLQNKSYY